MLIHMRKTVLSFGRDTFLGKSHLYFSTSKGNPKHVNTPTVSEFLMQKHNLSPQVASRVASAVTHIKNPENSDSIISFLKENGFSNAQLNKILESRPQLLLSSFENTIKPKFKFFKDFGFSDSQIAVIISKDPWLLKKSLESRVIPSLSVLNSLLGSSDDVAKLLMLSGWFLEKDLDKLLVPNIEFLVSCGVPMEKILKVIFNFPRVLLVKPDFMRRRVEKARELGVDRGSSTFLYAVRVLSSLTDETWELKFQAFRELGFSDGDILGMFKKVPPVFLVSMEKIKTITEILLATGKYDMLCISSSPMSLTQSIEKRYKPRLQVLEILESRDLIKKWPSINALYKDTDKQFFKKFVEPYLNELSEVDMAKSVLMSVVKRDVRRDLIKKCPSINALCKDTDKQFKNLLNLI